jgi:4-hydroxy-2-oxoheptanedioate aldolase
MADFTQAANKETLIAVQIEDEAALANVDAILKVEGIDVFFIGPSDLSASMGHPGNPKAEPVAKAIDATLKQIVAAGKTPGMPATKDNVAAAIGKGVRYIYTHAPTLLGAASAEFLKAAR